MSRNFLNKVNQLLFTNNLNEFDSLMNNKGLLIKVKVKNGNETNLHNMDTIIISNDLVHINFSCNDSHYDDRVFRYKTEDIDSVKLSVSKEIRDNKKEKLNY